MVVTAKGWEPAWVAGEPSSFSEGDVEVLEAEGRLGALGAIRQSAAQRRDRED